MDTEKTKVCKICSMDIPSEAKKCPYCQHYQYKWSLITFHPLFGIIPVMIIFLIFYGYLGKAFQSRFSKGEPFSQYASSVSIVETKMVFGIGGCKYPSPTIAILGKIQNNTPIPWKDIKMEATFFDENGELIDATQLEKYSFVVAAMDKSTFKLSFMREFPKEQYNNFKIRIISAKDERKDF